MQKIRIQNELERAFTDLPKYHDYDVAFDPVAFYFMNLESTTFYIRKSKGSYDLIICNFHNIDFLEKKLHLKSKLLSGTRYILAQVFSYSDFYRLVRLFYSLSYTLLNYYKSYYSKENINSTGDIQNELCFTNSNKK